MTDTITPGTLVLGQYRILKPLGGGGMGSVYLARDETLDRLVALKMMLPDPAGLGPEEGRARMVSEARAMARVRHPALAEIYMLHAGEQVPWIAMEYIKGRSLAERIDARESFTDVTMARIALPVALGLNALHDKSVFHRDVKPANIMTSADRDRAVLVDFGIARIAGDPSMTGQRLIGSPEFMAPERMEARRPGDARQERQAAASDVWSLGLTIFHAIEGFSPFRRPDWAGMKRAVQEEDLPPMRRPGKLAGLVVAMLQKDPADRPDGKEVARVLREVVQGAVEPDGRHSYRVGRSRGDSYRYDAQQSGLQGQRARLIAGPPPFTGTLLTPRQLEDEIAVISRSGTDTGAQRLLDLAPADAAKVLSGCEPVPAARLIDKIAAGDPVTAGQLLKMLSESVVAVIFDHLSSSAAATILSAVTDAEGVRLTRLGSPRRVARAFEKALPGKVGEFLPAMGDTLAAKVLGHADADRVAAILATVHADLQRRLLWRFDTTFRLHVERFLRRS